ncbi:MAG: type III polyketide synthase [Myxococcales bacterium]|nr:type III polyketide synthase [Myxococcales bacterium]
MAEPRLVSLGRAVPAQRFTQREVYAHNPWEDTPLMDRLFLASPVQSRAMVVPPSFYDQPRTLTETNAAWLDGALSLGGTALTEALARSPYRPGDVDVIGVTTVTGYATPGLDLLLAKAHELPRTLQRVHFNCIGCHAAIPLLRTVADHVARRPGAVGLALAVEVCSACFAPRPEPQNLVAVSLFADGAACAVVSTEGSGPAIVDFQSVFDLDHIDALGFDLHTTGFAIVLDPAIPDLVARAVTDAVDVLLERNGHTREDVAAWCLHPGGSRILDAAQTALSLSDEQMQPSRRVLRGFGNMSSPSVLFVLSEVLASQQLREGAPIVCAAFGPGLGVETVLLRAGAPRVTGDSSIA